MPITNDIIKGIRSQLARLRLLRDLDPNPHMTDMDIQLAWLAGRLQSAEALHAAWMIRQRPPKASRLA